MEIKCRLDATEVFIADLIACSTCFGHHYAHHQELEYYTVIAACGISCCSFQVVSLVWSWGLCVRFAGCCSILQTGQIGSSVKVPAIPTAHDIYSGVRKTRSGIEWHAASYPELYEPPPPPDPIACRHSLLLVDQMVQSGTLYVPNASIMSWLPITNLAQEMKWQGSAVMWGSWTGCWTRVGNRRCQACCFVSGAGEFRITKHLLQEKGLTL